MTRNLLLRLELWALRALKRPYYDLPLLGALLLLATIGLTTLYSASDLDRHLVLNQAARFVLGGILMLVIARIRGHLCHLSFCNLVSEDPAHALSLGVDLEHDACRRRPVEAEELF